MADAFEAILVACLAFAFLPERPTRSQGGTDGSNPLSSRGESAANPISAGQGHRLDAPSSAESATNLVAAGGVARGWDPEFESALLQRRVCELSVPPEMRGGAS